MTRAALLPAARRPRPVTSALSLALVTSLSTSLLAVSPSSAAEPVVVRPVGAGVTVPGARLPWEPVTDAEVDPTTMTDAELAAGLLVDPNLVRTDETVTADLQQAAAGRPGTAGAATARPVLLLMAEATRDHVVAVSALQDGGAGHATNSRHYSGAAVDFTSVDGEHVTGRDPGSRMLIDLATTVLPAGSGIGQSQCGSAVSVPATWATFPDSCDHLHVQLPA